MEEEKQGQGKGAQQKLILQIGILGGIGLREEVRAGTVVETKVGV